MTILDVTATGTGIAASGPALPVTLATGTSATVALRFTPSTTGDFQGAVTVNSSLDVAPLTVATYTGRGILPSSQVVAAPSSVDFGSVSVGGSASKTVTLTNGGSKSISITSATSSSPAVTTSGLALPATLAPGASTTFQIVFAPSSAGAATGYVAFRSAPSRPLAVVEFTGNGTSSTPMLSASPGQIDFRDVPVGEFSTQAVTLTNPSAASVTISAVSATGAGVSAGGLALPATVAPGASTTLRVTFTPTAVGPVSGSVSVLGAGGARLASIPCVGSGVAAAGITSVTVLDASVEASRSVQLAAVVVATGTIDTSVSWSMVSGSLGTVDPNTGVYTAPATAGAYQVRATSKADPAKQGTGTVTVTAPTVPVAVSVSPTSASVTTGGTQTFAATVTGSTNTAVTWSVQEGAAGGSITASGVYTAPASAGTYHVVARSQADTTKSATATVTVTAPAPPPPPPPPAGVVPAFPGAQGGGALSVGGRGGRVMEVTNLNDSGTGSLRACVTASGPRICVFRVGGTISLSSGLIISNPYLTIAGQTAPGGGIQIAGKNICNYDPMLGIQTHDVTIRYLRVRKGYCASTPVNGGGGVSIWSGSYNVIVDHSSIFWSQDEDFCVWGNVIPSPRATTASWNIVAESLSTAFGIGAETREVNDGMTGIDLHHNYIANNSHRQPLAGNAGLRIVNNIIYNYNFYATQVEGGIRADIVGNVYKRGPSGTPLHEITVYPTGYSNTATGTTSLYVTGNVGPSHSDSSTDGWSHMVWQVSRENGSEVQVLPTTYRRSTPQPVTGIAITPDSAATLDQFMLPLVGASRRLDCSGNWVNTRDAADARVVNNYWTATGQSAISSDSDVGGIPSIASGTACADSDHDGMPDTWEAAHGLNPNDATDGPRVTADGFTNLEHYLNGQ